MKSFSALFLFAALLSGAASSALAGPTLRDRPGNYFMPFVLEQTGPSLIGIRRQFELEARYDGLRVEYVAVLAADGNEEGGTRMHLLVNGKRATADYEVREDGNWVVMRLLPEFREMPLGRPLDGFIHQLQVRIVAKANEVTRVEALEIQLF